MHSKSHTHKHTYTCLVLLHSQMEQWRAANMLVLLKFTTLKQCAKFNTKRSTMSKMRSSFTDFCFFLRLANVYVCTMHVINATFFIKLFFFILIILKMLSHVLYRRRLNCRQCLQIARIAALMHTKRHVLYHLQSATQCVHYLWLWF